LLSNIPDIVSTSVTFLDFTRNSLTTLEHGTFSNPLPNLVELKLRENRIARIVTSSSSPSFVTSSDENVFTNVPALQKLDLGDNNLTVLGRDSFRHAEHLLHLDLSGNQLTDIHGAFDGLKDLSRFD